MDKNYQRKIDLLNKESWDLCRVNQNKSNDLAVKAEVLSIYHNYNKGLADSLLNKGWYNLSITNFAESKRLFKKAKDLYIKNEDIVGQLKSNAGISGIYFHIGSYQDCISLNMESIEIASDNNLIDRMITAMVSNVLIYIELNKLADASTTAEKALKLGRNLESFEQEPILLKSLADIYFKLGNKDSYIKYLKKSYGIYKKNGEFQGEFECLNSLGKHYMDLNQIEKAEGYFLKSVSLSKGSPFEECMLYDISHFYFSTNNLDESLKYLKQAISLSKKLNSANCLKNCYSLYSKIAEINDEDEKALYYFKKSIKYERELQIERDKEVLNKLESKVYIKEMEKENKELENKNKLLNIVSTISKEVISALEPMELSCLIYRNIKDLMDVTTFGLAYYNDDEKYLDFKIFLENNSNIKVGKLKLDDKNSYACCAIRNKKDIYVSDDIKEEKDLIGHRKTFGLETNSLIYMPIYYKDEVLGLLSIQSIKKNAYLKEHLDILELIRPFIAIAIRNTIEHKKLDKSYKEIQKVSYTDYLTGVNNRRYFSTIINSEYLLKLIHTPISFLFFDVDYFKVINSQYGYSVGDQLIDKLCKRISSALNESQTLIRWGGEEFLILDRGSDYLELKDITDKLLSIVSREPFWVDSKKVYLTISIGFLHLSRQNNQPIDFKWERFVNLAEKALAQAKKAGRNCSVGISVSDELTNNNTDDEILAKLSEEYIVTSI